MLEALELAELAALRQDTDDEAEDRLTFIEDRLTFTGDENAEEDDEDVERERERELRARVRGLQQQLEGLQLATATLQAVVSHTGAATGAALPSSSRQQESARTPDSASSSSQEPRARGRMQQLRAARGAGGSREAGQAAALRRTEPGTLASTDDVEDMDQGEVHPHVTCDGCGAGPPIFGQVMKCNDCDDFDFCYHCYQERDRIGHPRDHRFVPRSAAVAEHGAMPMMAAGHGPMAGILLRLLEAELLYEALRQSSEPDGVVEETQEEKEMRSAEVLSTMERIRYAASADHPDEECSLCLEEYTLGEELLKLPCRHLFHEGCLGPWFTRSLTCPLCKQEVPAPTG